MRATNSIQPLDGVSAPRMAAAARVTGLAGLTGLTDLAWTAETATIPANAALNQTLFKNRRVPLAQTSPPSDAALPPRPPPHRWGGGSCKTYVVASIP